MNAKKTPPEGRRKGRGRTWARRGLLAVLAAAAAVMAWGRFFAPEPPAQAPRPSVTASRTPAPQAAQERSARETAYDKDVAALNALLDSDAADADTRAQAARQLERLIADHQSELGLEEALNEAGFAPCLVLLQNGALTVVVPSAEMRGETGAAIVALCTAHTDIGAENIRIMARQEL